MRVDNSLEADGKPSEDQTSARARNRVGTETAILDAAEAVFAQFGLQASRTDEIAARAGVAKGLLFHYFRSKEALYEEVLKRAYEPLRSVINAPVLQSAPADEALMLLAERLLTSMNKTPLAPAIFILESLQNRGEHYQKLGMPSLYRRFEEILRRGVRSGVFRKLDPYHTSVNIMGMCSYYFCAKNNFSRDKGDENPLDSKALAVHKREVLAFVRSATQKS